MMTGLVQDQNLEKQIEKQIGCMSGFLQIFDRQHVLAGKRICSTKRLPPSTGASELPEKVKFVASLAVSRELAKPVVPASPDRFQSSPAANPNGITTATPPKSPLPLPMFELKDRTPNSSWKFCKEMPRLSLDSRATVDSKGSLCPKAEDDGEQRRSTSVIARLMGLEALPSSNSSSSQEIVKTPELRRSASESRVSRDLFHSRFIDGNNFQVKQSNPQNKQSVRTNLSNNNGVRENVSHRNASMEYSSRNLKSEPSRTSPWRSPQQRRSFFDTTDFFPEPKQTTALMYRDFEKKLKMRGIYEQSEDLETLKHILEALQLKGLLHSKRSSNRDSHRNLVYDRNMDSDEAKIVLMKPRQSPASYIDYGATRRYANERSPDLDRNGRSPARARSSASLTRNQSNFSISNSIIKRKPLNVETPRRVHESTDSRRSSPANSPKFAPKRSGSDPQSITNRSPRNRKPVDRINSKEKVFKNIVTEDESSSLSESTVSTSSQTDTERSKMEEYREGKSLLERCDKLLHSIAEMNSATESQLSSASVVPSPVSVLDSGFDKDESSPSPVMKRRSIDFKDPAVDLDDEIWSPAISPVKSTKHKQFLSGDSDFIYISDVLRALQYLPEESGIFFLLEKQRNDISKVSTLERKLVFDVTLEILDRNRQSPPWKVVTLTDSDAYLKQIWLEFQKIRERDTAGDDLLEMICGVLKKDLAGINGWEDHPVETSEAVLDIERLIFKDLVSEVIGDMAEFAGKCTFPALRRRLMF